MSGPRTVLALDTATSAVVAGVLRCEPGAAGPPSLEVLAERITVDPRAHAERLTPNVLDALRDAGVDITDVQAVVVGCGPGPFTGLRVGMATAAGYGQALGIPVHGVCSLDAIGVRTSGEALVVTDARRREIYWARYRDGRRIDGPAVAAPADVDPGSAAAVAGSPQHAGLFGLPVLDIAHPDAAGLAAAVTDWNRAPAPLRPRYLRRPDAKSRAERATVQYGPLRYDDAERCAELESQLFPGDDPWPRAAFLRELEAPHNRYTAARVGDEVVGYAGISRLGRTPPFEYEIHTIGVDPAHQGHGIGRRLLAEMLEFAGDGAVHLEVRTDNDAAIGLYRDAGFVTVGLRKRYYRASGADAYTMRREAGAGS